MVHSWYNHGTHEIVCKSPALTIQPVNSVNGMVFSVLVMLE